MTVKDFRNKYLAPLSNIYDEREALALIIRIIEHYSNLSASKIRAYPETEFDDNTAVNIINALDEVCTSRPLQYVLGQTEFSGRRFFVNPDVLIPRPETEELVQIAVNDNKGKSLEILDLCTGSGCIAISLACELPQAICYATDISESALKTARRNAEANRAAVQFAIHDAISNNELPFNRKFDLIVSNPPYVRMSEKASMHSNVLNHEPHIALFVSDDSPLIFYEACIKLACEHLKPTGTIYVEINENLGNETQSLFIAAGFNVEIIKDISGKDRIIKAKRISPTIL
jgi:release factor glutamine methyltransferase